MASLRPVTVQFYKNPDVLHWGFEGGYWLGEDEWGTWTGVPTGTKRWKGETAVRDTRTAAVFCAPRDGWWHLHYGGESDHSDYVLFIDIVTPPIWVSPNRYEMIDLDLDVGITADNEIVVEDEDEFEAHRVKFGYSEEMIRRARSETDHIVAALEGKQEPFFQVAAAWLGRVE
jgi:protein associated with RNAse G/E